MAEAKKIIRLADVGELEADLKKDLAEEEAKGKVADVLYCESIGDELSDLGNLPASGGMVGINLTVNYNFIPDRVVELYSKFNGMDGEALVESRIQNSIIAYVKEVTPQFSVMDIYSERKTEVNNAITDYLNQKLTSEYGINVSSALVIDVELDDTLTEKIRAKEQAKQDAEIAELNKQTALAQAETDKVKAQAEADVKVIEAQAEAEANKVVSESITPELIQMKEAEARLKHGWVTVQGADTVVTQQGN